MRHQFLPENDVALRFDRPSDHSNACLWGLACSNHHTLHNCPCLSSPETAAWTTLLGRWVGHGNWIQWVCLRVQTAVEC